MSGYRLEAYERSLPEGLASYPHCQHRAEFYCGFIERVPLAGVAARLPAPLRTLVDTPPKPSAWVHEVHLTALYLAACDLVLDHEQQLIDTLQEVNYHALRSPLNRIMFMVATPRILLGAGNARWRAFHRGSVFETQRRGAGGSLRLSYPEHLFPELIAKVYEAVFQTVMDLVCDDATVRLIAWKPTVATYDVSWG